MAPPMTYASSWALQVEASARWDDAKTMAAALDAVNDLGVRALGADPATLAHDMPPGEYDLSSMPCAAQARRAVAAARVASGALGRAPPRFGDAASRVKGLFESTAALCVVGSGSPCFTTDATTARGGAGAGGAEAAPPPAYALTSSDAARRRRAIRRPTRGRQ